jgi:hypothetical protein
MIRQAAAVVIVLLLSPSWLTAQGTELTVSVSSASVHKAPSTASPVIGHAARGAHLQVTREVGDWVKVAWPAAADGVGYVRVSVGSVANGTAASAPLASKTTAPAPVQSTPRVTTTSAVEPTQTGNRLPVRNTAPSSGTSHVFGVGALMGGPSFGLGVSARVWSHRRLGVGFALSRYEVSNPIELGSMSSTEFGPSVLFSFNDRIADYTWLRPYLGAGFNFYRSTINSPLVGAEMSDSRYGSQLFGGGELSFASVPRFAVSTELSYRWFNAPAIGYDLGGVGLTVAGHWYVK